MAFGNSLTFWGEKNASILSLVKSFVKINMGGIHEFFGAELQVNSVWISRSQRMCLSNQTSALLDRMKSSILLQETFLGGIIRVKNSEEIQLDTQQTMSDT